MEKAPLDLSGAYRLLNPGCVVLVSTGDGRTDNLFALTWNMPVRKEPCTVAVLTGKRHFSYPLVERTGEFGINVLDARLVDAIYGCGTTTGHTGLDKFRAFGLTRQRPRKIKPPLVEEAVATLECRVAQVVDLGASALLIANVLHAMASTEHCPGGNYSFGSGLELVHHLGGTRFALSGKEIHARKYMPKA